MTPPRETLIDTARDAANFCALRGDHGSNYAIAIRQLIAALAAETAQREAAERERDTAASRAFDNEMLGRVAMGRVMALEAERDRLTAALTEAQRERDKARA